jgi:uncharacterized tellurite resistance protein B-like protein
MFERFVSFMEGLGNKRKPEESGPPQEQVAAAAILFSIMDADGVRHKAEMERLTTLLSEKFDVEGATLSAVIASGEEAENEAVDLYQFTRTLVNLEEDERIRFIEIIWEVVFADGEVHELEDNLVWRIAELIGISHRDRMLMKQKVAGKSPTGSA